MTDPDPGKQHCFPALEDGNLYVPGVVLIVVGQGFLVILRQRGLTGVQELITLRPYIKPQYNRICRYRYRILALYNPVKC